MCRGAVVDVGRTRYCLGARARRGRWGRLAVFPVPPGFRAGGGVQCGGDSQGGGGALRWLSYGRSPLYPVRERQVGGEAYNAALALDCRTACSWICWRLLDWSEALTRGGSGGSLRRRQ